MRIPDSRGKLRQIQSRDKKSMARKFDNTRFALGSSSGHLQIIRGNLSAIFGREPVAAAKLFRRLRLTVEFLDARSGLDDNGLADAGKRTSQLADYQTRRTGSYLFVRSIGQSQDISRIL